MKKVLRFLSWLPSQLLGLLKSLNPKYSKALVYTYVLGTFKGYSFDNITFMINQITHETGHGTSNAIQTYNNTNGMNCVAVRPTTQTSCTDNAESLGVYPDIYDSIIDRFMWDDYWGFDALRGDSSYITAVCSKYHTSPDYEGIVSSLGNSLPKSVRLVSVAVFPLEIAAPVFIYSLIKK